MWAMVAIIHFSWWI